MKVLFTALSLWAVAVFALRGDKTRYRYELVEPGSVEVFRSGQTYRYQLDTQISTGMASVSDQHAVTRIQCEVMLHFQSDRKVTLKLNDVIVGSVNREIDEPERVQPIEMFKKHEIKQEDERLLETPCMFDYEEGLIGNIYFQPQDRPWSMNIKKTVLNMLQLNLKQRTNAKSELEQIREWQQDWQSEYESKTESQSKMFVMPEITLEGECQTTYTLNKMSSRKYASYSDDEMSRDDVKMFNVTKSIDFKKCGKIADIRYGPKVEKPCDNCTTPEELEERKLDRTTVIRHMLVGTPEKYGIQRVEIVSHYVFKTLNVEEEKPMHAIVAGELNYLRNEESRRREIESELKGVSINGKEETLLYTTTWDEKEKMWYMFGDDQFPQETPFDKVQDKPGKIEKLMNKLVSLWSDKTKGIETEATLVFTRIVEMLRMCSQEELKKVFSTFSQGKSRLTDVEQLKAEEILVDALANAGTHNTIKVLVEKIIEREIPMSRTVRALTQLKDLPAPSDKQVETLTKLCQHETCSRYQACRQTCWLTAGAILGELCDEELTVKDALEQKKDGFCSTDIKNKFIEQVMKYINNKAQTRYDKILLLKALGNAGLDLSIFKLEEIIRNPREDPLVRMQAIDSLRRLRAVMPEKIQRVLMPVFQNTRERPEVRMACVSQIMATLPEKPILDMIGLVLIREPSRQVKSYVYTAMKSYSESPIRMERELAQHLKALLKMAGISEEDEEVLLKGSRHYRIPIYSRAQKEGIFMDMESIVGPDNVLPKHLHLQLDSFLNGIFKKSNIELSFTQEDLENWYDNIMNVFMDYYYGDFTSKKSSLRGYRTSRSDSSENDQDFKTIFSSLSIKRRSWTDSSDSSNSPYAMLSFRLGDVDYAIFPFEEEILPEPLKKIVQGSRPSLSDFEKLIESRPFAIHIATNLLENSVKIPTSMGLPIRMLHVLPILASLNGQIRPKISLSEVKVELKVHKQLTVTHLKRIEVWSPIINTGLETTRTGALNLPLQTELTVNLDTTPKTFKWNVKVPEHEFKILSFHSLPITFVSELEWMQQRTPIVKRLENKELMHRAKHIEQIYGHKNFDLPIKVSGEIHIPHRYTYEDIVNMLMTTENHINVEFRPSSEMPREIVLIGEAKLFGQNSDRDSDRVSHRETFKSFYTKSKFDDEMDQYYENDEEDEQKFDKFLNEYEPRKMYQHMTKLILKTVGGRRDKMAHIELRGSCDNKLRVCKAQVEMKRSPLNEESREWTLKTNIQAVLPEKVHDIQEYQEKTSSKQHKFVCTIESEWGSDRKQQISLNINGERIRNKYWSEKIREIEKHDRYDMPKLREQMNRKVAFLNKFDVAVQYKNVLPTTQNFFNWGKAILKSWNFWNTEVEFKNNRESQILATIVIDPLTHEHVNVTLKTPTETIRVNSFSLPMKVKPFKLVSAGQSSVDSFTDIVRNYATESRAECKVDSRKVRTFDDVTMKAPLTKCYTVLAKDCENDSPRFAVLMKKINNQDKKLKVFTNGDNIEIEPESQDKLVVKVNGRRINDYDSLRDYGVEYDPELVRIETRDFSVRFDGQQAWVRVSPFYKSSQCGLCGHYDDDTEDEYRMNNDELTSDIKAYHKSYSLQDDECRNDFEETQNREEYERISDSREYYERDNEYQERRRLTNENNEMTPIEKTEVIEHSHKICFSVKPVKTCPEGSYPDKTKDQKVSFTCMDRTSSEARRLLRQARRYNEPIEIPSSSKNSFTQQLTVPTTCVVY